MDRDIRATIERLEQRIAKLQQARQILLEEYGSAGDDAPAPRIGSTGSLQEAFATLFGESADGGPDGAKTRKEMIVQFLRTNGPSRRREIIEKTGIPAGTVGYELRDANTFQRLDGGRWGLKG